MVSKVKYLVELSGIDDCIPHDANIFKQFSFQNKLVLPETKPDIQKVHRIHSQIFISKTKVIQTPKAVSLEGQHLTGLKLIVEGEIKQEIEYVAKGPLQQIHAAHFSSPFCTFVILPPDVDPIHLKTQGYIEDIFAEPIDEQTIFTNITIFIHVNLCL